MRAAEQDRFDQILQILKWNPRGMTISDISSKMRLNRNLVSKYLDMLLVSGQAEVRMVGTAKVYSLAPRVPISDLLDFSSDMVIVLDSSHTIQRVNEPVLRVLDERRDAVIGMDIAESKNPFLCALNGQLSTPGSGNPVREITDIRCTLNDEKYHFRVKQIPTVFEDGSQGITFIAEDITEQAAYQENLAMSEARYRGIVEDQTEFIVRFLPDNSLIFANEAYARYLDRKKEDLIGQSHPQGVLSEDVSIVDETREKLSPGTPVTTFECRILHPSGQIRWNSWTTRAFYDDHGDLTGFQGVGRDITENHNADLKLKRYIKAMEYLAKTGTAFRDMGEDDDIYKYVASEVYTLAPGFLVWVGILDETGQNLVLKGVSGNPIAIETVQQLTGMDMVGMSFPINVAETAELIQHRKLVKTPPLYRLLHMQVPEEVCQQIEDATAVGIDSYLMGLVSKGKIVGDVGISNHKGSELPNRDIIEAFIRQAAIAIDRKIADDSLRQSLAREQEQVRNLQFLSDTAMDFIEMDDSTDIFYYIGKRLHELVPDSIIGINSFDTKHQEITLRSVVGDGGKIEKLWDILGINLLGSPSTISQDSQDSVDFSADSMVEVPALNHIFYHRVPEKICTQAEQMLGPGKSYGLAFTCKGGIFGNVLIRLTRSGGITNREIVEAFVNQSSVALLRRYARQQHRESEERFRFLLEQTPYPLVILGQDGHVIAANGLAADLIGCCEVSGIAGKSFSDYLVGSDDMLQEYFQGLTSDKGRELSRRFNLRSQTGGMCEVDAWGKKIHYNNKPSLLLTFRILPDPTPPRSQPPTASKPG